MKTKKIITICSSASHYRQAIEVERQLKALGFAVKMPKTAGIMKRTGNFNAAAYKTWYQNAADYSKKDRANERSFQKN